MDELMDLVNRIADAKLNLEELNEAGDLEERLEAAELLAELEEKHFRLSMIESGGL